MMLQAKNQSLMGQSANLSDGAQYRALFSYQAEDPTELSLSAGESVRVLSRESDWWYGESRGAKGWFPAGYVSLPEKASSSSLKVDLSNAYKTILDDASEIASEFDCSAPALIKHPLHFKYLYKMLDFFICTSTNLSSRASMPLIFEFAKLFECQPPQLTYYRVVFGSVRLQLRRR